MFKPNQTVFLLISLLGFATGFGDCVETIGSEEPPADAIHEGVITGKEVDFSRDISPIFSRHCLACHGPDPEARQGGFRLDDERSAKRETRSGVLPIVPGQLDQSAVWHRINSDDPDDRMPPEDHPPLNDEERILLSRWIQNGAPYQQHWSYRPVIRPPLPTVEETTWPRQAVDHFILARLEEKGIQPARDANRRDWLRRVSFDLLGLPPTPEALERFENDPSPSARERVVNRLLASPRYGERWGRHWLDVARYGDSNGGDENHAYPNAYRYRNYVIDAFNAGTPFDQMIAQQLAGDLLPTRADSRQSLADLKATGFLAVGTKILAEQDPVKKQADTVDEQIDTISKAFLATTVACARCHDHKFDPVPTEDYYAFAGILHSTAIEETPLKTPTFLAQERTFRRQLATVEARLQVSERNWQQIVESRQTRTFEAEDFTRGNVTVDSTHYGKGIGIISDPGGQDNFAEYDFSNPREAPVALEIRYAAKTARPGRILLNGTPIVTPAFSQTTGGWFPDQQSWHLVATIQLRSGSNTLRFESKPNMVHLDQFRLIPLTKDLVRDNLVDQLRELRAKESTLWEKAPSPPLAMGVHEGKIQNTSVHLRGDHNQLGAEVPRGFLSRIGTRHDHPVAPDQSGRLELAQWLTDSNHPLTARVFVNRLWRWHFGRGIVGTTEDFGIRGERPSHPLLLDFLAREFVESGWSIKHLHRILLLSRTYGLSTRDAHPQAEHLDPGNRLYWKRELRRLEAEPFRDSLLALSGRLNLEMEGGAMNVKSQDPSPEDLIRNRKIYEASARRTVYLPVVRSHVYDFLTLLDFPNANSPVGNRPTTTVPTQALLMMNHDFVQREAEQMVTRIHKDLKTDSVKSTLHQLYRRLLGRHPDGAELEEGLNFIARYSESIRDGLPSDNTQSALVAFCQTLLMSNEFAYVW